MNCKANLARYGVLTLSLTLAGCGSAQVDPANTEADPTATQPSSDAPIASVSLVTLELPGMT
ncbi:MAG: hypothetical protein ACR2NM_12080 [Bythopirellula sp.]